MKTGCAPKRKFAGSARTARRRVLLAGPGSSHFTTNRGTLAHLLLIDDDPVQLSTREAVLRHAGFAVSIATTAEGALAVMKSEPLASSLRLIITDHVMPGATGAQFVRALRAVNSTVPVIVVSGMPEIESEYQGLNVRFLPKPCFPQHLIERVKECLEQSPGAGK